MSATAGKRYADPLSYLVQLRAASGGPRDEIACLAEQAYCDLYGPTDLEIIYAATRIAVDFFWIGRTISAWIDLEPESLMNFPSGSSRSPAALISRCLIEIGESLALVVLLKGINVGGHRTFRPSVLARELKRFDFVNIGAAGTFVVRKTVHRARLRAEITRRLPFQADVMICNGSDILRFASGNPFLGQPSGPDIVRFVSLLARRRRLSYPVPLDLPTDGEWCLRILSYENRFVFGLHRRQMKAISYLGQLEKLFGVPVATRGWNTIQAIVRALET